MKKFDHFKSNLNVLALADQEDLTNEFIIGGIIDKFFIQFELGWKVLKELLNYEAVICDEVGCGVVPMERHDRERREAIGRLCCQLAQEAQAVYRLQCGLAMRLK